MTYWRYRIFWRLKGWKFVDIRFHNVKQKINEYVFYENCRHCLIIICDHKELHARTNNENSVKEHSQQAQL